MKSTDYYNPQHAGAASLGQSQGQEAKLIAEINSNRWFIWGWAALNTGAAFVSSLAEGLGAGGASLGAISVALIFGVPAFLLFRNQGFYSACALFAFAIFNAVSGVLMALSGAARLNFGTGLIALSIIVITAMIAMDAYKLRGLRKARA
jgi:hypothetical protein